LKDYAAMEAAFADTKREPIVYDIPIGGQSAKPKLGDAEALTLIKKYAKEAGQHAQRIVRMMRADGHPITTARVEELLFGPVEEKAAKAKKKPVDKNRE
jgi:hypothetical protein